MAAHVYWRINIFRATDGSSRIALREIEMRATAGGADQCTGGTATARNSLDGTQTPDKAVDNSYTTQWRSDAGAPCWWQYQFASAVEVLEVAMAPRDVIPNSAPKEFSIEYSDDGTNWYTEWSVSGVSGWVADTLKVFTKPTHSLGGSRQYWRFFGKASASGIQTEGGIIAELEMRATVGGADQCTGGTASASSGTAANAFDNNNTTNLAWTGGTFGWSYYAAYAFASAVSVAEYAVAVPNGLSIPVDWEFQSSTDGSGWLTEDRVDDWT